MVNLLKEFWLEEEGMGTVEIVLIIAVLVSVALMFRGYVIDFVKNNIGEIFGKANENASIDTGDAPGLGD